MALDRFKSFVEASPEGVVSVGQHGVPSALSFVQRFLQKHQRTITVGLSTVAAGATLAASSLAMPGVNLHIHEKTFTNTVYQSVETHLPGHAAAREQRLNGMRAFIGEAHEAGILPVMPTFHEVALNADDASHAGVNNDGSCDVQMALDKDGLAGSLGVSMAPVHDRYMTMHRDATIAHESAHCSLPMVENPFRHSGLSAQTEGYINQWLMEPATYGLQANSPKVYDTFNETQADVLGEMIMLRKNHFSADAWKSVDIDYQDRMQQQVYEEIHGEAFARDSHNTSPGLRKLIEQRATVEQLDPHQYQDFALGLASQSLIEVFDGAKLRASPLAHAAAPDSNGDNEPSYLGKQGYNLLTQAFSIQGMRSIVAARALDLHAEQLGLRVAPPASQADNLPRQLAQRWIDKDTLFTRGVTMASDKSGSNYSTVLSDDARNLFLNSSPELGRKGIIEARAKMGMDQVTAELAQALHVDDASLAKVVAPTPIAVVTAVTAPTAASFAPRIPSFAVLSQRIDQRMQAVLQAAHTVEAGVATVSRRLGM